MKNLRLRAPLGTLAALTLSMGACAQQQVYKLPESVVTVNRYADSVDSMPAGVSVITGEDIRRSGATSINEALMRLLGVVGRQDFFGGGEYALDLRGFGASADSNQVIVVDGQRLNESDIGGSRVAGIPIESVARIEVLRGSAGVLYGEGATGGVILITTKSGQGSERRNQAQAYVGTGSYGLRETRAQGTLASGGFSLDVAAQKRDADNHRDNFRSGTDALSLGLQWSNDWLRLGLRSSRDDLETRLPGALTAAQFATNPRQSTTPGDFASVDNQRQGLYAEASLGDWQLSADMGWRSKKVVSLNGGLPFDYDIDADSAALRARHDGTMGGAKNTLIVGLDQSSWRRQIPGAFGSVATHHAHAFYVKDDLVLPGSGTRLSAGWRSEQVRKDDSNTATTVDERPSAWEFGLSQPLGGAWVAYGRLARSFRLPSVDEFSFTSPGVTLTTQRSSDIEGGLRWKSEGTRVDARLYRSRLSHEIGFDPTAPGPFGPGANVNFDPTRRQGLELEASHAWSRALNLRANLALREATFRAGANAGRDVPLVPGATLALRADWSPAAGHQLGGGVNWVAWQHPDFANQCRIPAYQTVDLRYSYRWRELELSLGMSNLLDRKYFTQAFACAGTLATSLYPEAGRAFTAALRVRF